uniref:Uncharacterized protein n=1 Tax=Anguilla anguilla TaxID=7936 RepID=A0A0E9R9T1_ANGAN
MRVLVLFLAETNSGSVLRRCYGR